MRSHTRFPSKKIFEIELRTDFDHKKYFFFRLRIPKSSIPYTVSQITLSKIFGSSEVEKKNHFFSLQSQCKVRYQLQRQIWQRYSSEDVNSHFRHPQRKKINKVNIKSFLKYFFKKKEHDCPYSSGS